MGSAAKSHDEVMQEALRGGLITDSSPCSFFIDEDSVRETIGILHRAFPKHFLHTFAVKANQTVNVMKIIYESGMGFEVASYGELHQSLKVCPSHRVIFDSPCKTAEHIKFAMNKGVNVNADNFEELDRMLSLTQSQPDLLALYTQDRNETSPRLGVRVNPQIGSGTNVDFSTAGVVSKFGVSLSDYRDTLIKYYSTHKELKMLHCHAGSQSLEIEQQVTALRIIVDLAISINDTIGSDQIDTIDIGGGLHVNFLSEHVSPTFGDYAVALQEKIPELFTGRFNVITEFGRAVIAKNGFLVSKIEYVKKSGEKTIAIQHAGANSCVRTVYKPLDWPLRIDVFDASGHRKPLADMEEIDIAGPCCFEGDRLAKDRLLPCIRSGDYILVHDVGGYYMSSYSRYNSLPSPAIVGYTTGASSVISFRILQKEETVEESLATFST